MLPYPPRGGGSPPGYLRPLTWGEGGRCLETSRIKVSPTEHEEWGHLGVLPGPALPHQSTPAVCRAGCAGSCPWDPRRAEVTGAPRRGAGGVGETPPVSQVCPQLTDTERGSEAKQNLAQITQQGGLSPPGTSGGSCAELGALRLTACHSASPGVQSVRETPDWAAPRQVGRRSPGAQRWSGQAGAEGGAQGTSIPQLPGASAAGPPAPLRGRRGSERQGPPGANGSRVWAVGKHPSVP